MEENIYMYRLTAWMSHREETGKGNEGSEERERQRWNGSVGALTLTESEVLASRVDEPLVDLVHHTDDIIPLAQLSHHLQLRLREYLYSASNEGNSYIQSNIE